MQDCPLCQVVRGETEAHVLAETERTAAFLDRHPATPGHTLVAPTTHRERLFAADGPASMAVLETVSRVAPAVREALSADGVSLFYSPGQLYGNVTHAHVHLVPRYTDDDIHLSLDREELAEAEAARLAARITDRL